MTEIKATIDEAKVLSVLRRWYDLWYSYREMEILTSIPVDQLKKIMQSLKSVDLVYYQRGLMNDDGEVAGSGWFLDYSKKRMVDGIIDSVTGRQMVYKQVKQSMPHCTTCGEMLVGNGSMINPYQCSCGEWDGDWSEPGKYKVKIIMEEEL